MLALLPLVAILANINAPVILASGV